MSTEADKATQPLVIHLDGQHADGRVVVYGEDKVFLLTVQEAVRACGMMDKAGAILDQMTALREKLKVWVADRRERVRSAMLGVKLGGLLFLVVTQGREFDPVLEDELTDLDVEVANTPEFDLLRMDVLALPNVPDVCVETFMRR